MSVSLLYSGGLDSTVLLYDLLKALRPGDEVNAIMINYGADHNPIEIEHGFNLIASLRDQQFKVNPIRVSLPGLINTKATYFPSMSFEEMPPGENPTIFHGRNLLLIATANTISLDLGAGEIWVAVGAHDAQGGLFPDCTFDFMMRLGQAMHHAYKTILHYPYIDKQRTYIVKRGAIHGVPFEYTYSCYRGGPIHCGICPTCRGRKAGFGAAGLHDPTEYVE